MSRKAQKTKKIGKNYFWLSGAQNLYFKEETYVNFTPQKAQPKR
jgi:hypothetical protein